MNLRPYQSNLKAAIYAAWMMHVPPVDPAEPWQSINAVCAVMPTGAGKTTTFASIVHEHVGASIVIAHRKELVAQMSMALAREGVPHRIIASNSTVKFIVQEQQRELGRSWFVPNARCAVAGIDTLVNKADELRAWLPQVTLGIMDEGHHVLRKNKWGKGIAMLPNARWALFTATPLRADGRGLGITSDGICHALVEGPPMRWLIDEGYLTDYELFCPDNDIDLSHVETSDATGDYVQNQLVKATKAAKSFVGDVVRTYQTNCPGKRTVVFAVDVEAATEFARKFNEVGVRAEVVTADTDPRLRNEIIRRFRRGELDVLCNCDLFGEGFDLPAIECVIFARATQSYPLFCQQFGRALRPMYADGYNLSTKEGRLAAIANSIKPIAFIFDHVHNSLGGHGLPDTPRPWSLNARDRRSRADNDAMLLKPCPKCTRVYERFRDACPYCGHVSLPANRGSFEYVDGDLTKVDRAVLDAARAAVARVDMDANSAAMAAAHAGAPPQALNAVARRHIERQDAQAALRTAISWWAGFQKRQGLSDSESYKRFYLTFNCDILTAQSLGRPEAFTLADRVNKYIGANCK